MKFIEVNYNDLKLGTKYIILNHLNATDNIYIETFNGYCNKYTIGEISHWRKTYISYLTNYNKRYMVGDLALNKYTFKRKYMILDSQKETIQNNMEARALNIILRLLIGDNHFSYSF